MGVLRLRDVINQTYSPINLVVGKANFYYIDKECGVARFYLDYEVIGIRQCEECIEYNLKKCI